MVRRLLVDEPLHCFDAGHAGADEDCRDDEAACVSLGALRSHQERDPEWDRSESVAEVVDQVGKERNAARQREDGRLGERRGPENGERDEDGADALAGTFDAVVDEPVGVTVIVMVVVVVGAVMRMLVDDRAVTVSITGKRCVYGLRCQGFEATRRGARNRTFA